MKEILGPPLPKQSTREYGTKYRILLIGISSCNYINIALLLAVVAGQWFSLIVSRCSLLMLHHAFMMLE